jgi:hypothetical protein
MTTELLLAQEITRLFFEGCSEAPMALEVMNVTPTLVSLAAQGPTGAAGPRGEQGLQGPPGPQGISGLETGYIVDGGNF